MVCRQGRSEVPLQLITAALLLSTSPPQAGKSLRLFFHLMPSFWHGGTTQQNELLQPDGTEQPAPPGDFLAFGPKSCVALVAWHEAAPLPAQMLVPVCSPTAFISKGKVVSVSSSISSSISITRGKRANSSGATTACAEGQGLLCRKLTLA